MAPMIIFYNNRYHIINLSNIMNANSIGIIEHYKTLLCSIHMKWKILIIKVAFIVGYQNPIENMFL